MKPFVLSAGKPAPPSRFKALAVMVLLIIGLWKAIAAVVSSITTAHPENKTWCVKVDREAAQ